MKTVACLIARTNSTRLPEKVLRRIGGRLLIEHIIDRLKMVSQLDDIILCTSTDSADARLRPVAERNDIRFYAGSPDSPLDRMLAVGKNENADAIVRVTGDNIFTDPVYLSEMLRLHESRDSQYTRTVDVPVGLGAEVMSYDALQECSATLDPAQSEYLMLYMFQPDLHRCLVLFPEPGLEGPAFSLTVDTVDDLERSRFIVENLESGDRATYPEILELHRGRGIPHFQFEASARIKLPGGRDISFQDFAADMADRTDRSEQSKLKLGHYATAISTIGP